MAKKKKDSKSKKTVVKAAQQIPWTTGETRGFLIFSSAFLLLLSLISFAIAPHSKNLLGLMGHTVGWALHAVIGLSSYALVVYIGWVGWRLLFGKQHHHLWLKHLYAAIAIISLSMLLTLVESDFPSAGQSLGSSLYPGLWGSPFRYHLGGNPFYYLYNDLPVLNIHRIFNTVGAALIFSCTLIASILFLFKVRLIDKIQMLAEKLRREAVPLPATAPPSKVEATKEMVKPAEGESSFMRFVKLRIPTTLQESFKSSPATAAGGGDLLGIQPDANPKWRPSISRKEQDEPLEVKQETKKEAFLPPMKGKKRLAPFAELDQDEREAFKRPSEPPVKNQLDKVQRRENALIAQAVHNGDFSHYKIPSLDLLTNPKIVDQTSLKKDLKRQAEVLEETLQSFGIEAKVGQINCGPTITSFEVHPAIGVKVQKIKTLDNDIALNMEAKSIRIIAPIPGKAAVGIEVPNSQPQEVGFKDMLLAYQKSGTKFHIPILLGKAVNGDYVMSDLAKMPHCIIAGATGSGKSVCINTIVMSILLNAKPDQIKLIMVDPKKVELTPYSKLPHMLAPVITEPQGAAAALNWLVKEMEKRYEILKLIGVRNIDSFNKRPPNAEHEATLEREIPAQLPYIVGIIDELADLMMVASSDIETPIARIAQMARAVGIHLILATQRPSREVITGLIKANFPARISFKVASRVNSQIILDEIGAESLLGNGDMLFLPPGSSHLTRAQGAFIRDEDIHAVVQAICEQAPTNYIIESFDRFHELNLIGDDKDEDMDLDPLYDQAKDVVLGTGNASTTFLQRKLKIGYARAASLMDQLERNGIVGPAEGSKPRKVFGAKKQKGEANEDDGGGDELFEGDQEEEDRE